MRGRIPACIAMLMTCTLIHADVEVKALLVPYSSAEPTVIGSGIDLELINQARFTCLASTDTAHWLDGEGSVATNAQVDLISDYNSLAKTLDLEVDYKSKADVSIQSLKAGGSVNLNIKYDTFAMDQQHTTAVVFKASSDYGRLGLSDYKLQPEFAKLLADGNAKTFRARCGTHTVVATQRQSMVAAVVTITDLTNSSKRSIEALFKSAFSGSAKLPVGAASASTETKLAWKNIVETAKKVGTVHITYEARGGSGIADATKLAITADPSNLDSILSAIASVGQGFSRDNSGTKAYILVPNSVFGAPPNVDSYAKLESLNQYYLRLDRIDYAITRVAGYKASFPELYRNVYLKKERELAALRANLLGVLETCVTKDYCPRLEEGRIDVLFVEDILLPDSFELGCGYSSFESVGENGRGTKAQVLSSISVNFRGRVRLAEYVSVETALINRFGADVSGVHLIPQFVSYSSTFPDKSGVARISAIVDFKVLHPQVETSNGNVYVRNVDDLTRERDVLQNSVYGISMQAKNGLSIVNTIGPPFGGNCPAVRTGAL